MNTERRHRARCAGWRAGLLLAAGLWAASGAQAQAGVAAPAGKAAGSKEASPAAAAAAPARANASGPASGPPPGPTSGPSSGPTPGPTSGANAPGQATPTLSSPVAGSPPIGSGPGFHDPRSVFKPLQEREGVVSWKLLSSVVAKVQRDKVIPVFPPAVRSLDATSVKVQGFMLPLEPGEKQRHFLLSAVPTTCNFCVPAGPEGLVEVRTREPIRYTVDAITVQGRFAVLHDDKYGLFYRVADASIAP